MPAAREDHTWTTDEAGTLAYLFGGRDGGVVFDDLWRYDLKADAWSKLEPEGKRPDARFGHTANWVKGVGLVVWSGQAGPRFFADVWAYDPKTNAWRELPGGGDRPAARYGSCASVGPDGRLWISHGFTEDTGRFSDTRAYDFKAGEWADETPDRTVPVIRCLHDCLWTPDGRLVLYAGQTTGIRAIGDLWTLEGAFRRGGARADWKQAEKPPLPARQLYALAAVGERAYVFGGTPVEGDKLDDLWTLDLDSLAWSQVRADRGPSGRSGATFIADPARDRLLLFGGLGDEATFADTWELRLTA